MSRITTCGSVFALAMLFGAMHTSANGATVIGQNGVIAGKYANVFDPNLDGTLSGGEATITVGAIGPGSVTSSNVSRVVNRVDARTAVPGGGRIEDTSGVATQGFMQFVTPSAFNVGTVLSVQRVTEGFNSPMNFALKLGTSSGTATVQTGPGTVGTHPYQLTNFAYQQQNLTHLRIEESMATTAVNGATRFGDFQEVLLFSQRLEAIPVTNITTSNTTFGNAAGVNDFSGSTGSGSVGGWASGTPGANPFFQLDFGTDKTVNGLVLSNWENIPIQGNILDDNNTIIAQFTMTGDNTVGEILPIEFLTPVTTSLLRVNFTNAGNVGIREAIALTQLEFMTPAPEPSTLCLGVLGLAALARVRRRQHMAG